MTELITMPQANHWMLIVLAAAPLIGLAWGVATKQILRGLAYGAIVGVGNFVLWNVYNAITDRLGLDTVKNLVVNLGLFIVLGIVAGILIGRFEKWKTSDQSSETAE